MTELAHTKTTALITGASSGIGYELAKVFARNGHNLILVARNEQILNQLADELRAKFGVTGKVILKDLSIITAAQEIVDELGQEAVSVDILVNNAGFDVYGNFYETDLTRELQMIQVNLVTLTQLTKLKVFLNFNTPEQKAPGNLSLEQAETYFEEGHFLRGSMGPKVQPTIRFVRWREKEAIITSLDKAVAAMEGKTGSRIEG